MLTEVITATYELQSIELISSVLVNVLKKAKLSGFGPRANYTNRATAVCWRS
jgi:hypothetical protein